MSNNMEMMSFHPSLAVDNFDQPLFVWNEVEPDSNVFETKGSLYIRTTPPKQRIRSVEFTQAIQELQSLKVMLKDLEDSPLRPVPVVAGKPAVMRVYLESLEDSTDVTVEVSDQFTYSWTSNLGTHRNGAANESVPVALRARVTVGGPQRYDLFQETAPTFSATREWESEHYGSCVAASSD